MTGAMFVDGSTAAVRSCNTVGTVSTDQCSCANGLRSVVRDTIRQYGDHYMDVWAEDIANGVNYRPAAQQWTVYTP